jgi:hypothetical protein
MAIVLAGVSAACSHWDSGIRPGEATVGKPVSSYPAPPFPALTKPGTIYVEREPLSAMDGVIQTATRYVLYDDGTFGLQASSVAQQYEYRGRYSRADSLITFAWEGWSSAGPWEASAILRGEELIVTYGLVMVMSDFVDATYRRAP